MALVDNIVVDVTIEKSGEMTEDVADVSMLDDKMECGNEIVDEVVESSGVEDCIVEVEDGGTGNKVARLVEWTITDKVEIAKENEGTALVETAPKDVAKIDEAVVIKDDTGIILDGILSALMMSAAYARALDLYYDLLLRLVSRTFSATPYTTACKCAAGITGKIPASMTLRFCVPAKCAGSASSLSSNSKNIKILR